MADTRQQDSHASCCIIIPARFASTRYPGKPLARLRGAGGTERTLIEWTWRVAQAVPGVSSILVATDDERIADEVARFGGRVAMTPAVCANGTERCAAALSTLPVRPDIIVNLQGDALLTPPNIIAALIRQTAEEPELPVATPAIVCTEAMVKHLLDDRAAGRVGGTTVVFNARADALYFSKNVIPYVPEGAFVPVHLHLGVYAYRPEALTAYVATPPSMLEQVEGLEQLRFLDAGVRMGIVPCDKPDGPILELNNPGDVPLIEQELRRREAN
jgi:3-deoxy-manno-octulosonate cytidylyltransferase (CMP-KDO synthetase)